MQTDVHEPGYISSWSKNLIAGVPGELDSPSFGGTSNRERAWRALERYVGTNNPVETRGSLTAQLRSSANTQLLERFRIAKHAKSAGRRDRRTPYSRI